MKNGFRWTAVTAVVFSLVGCARITSQVTEMPRLDQELEGNRGYLAGTPPAGEISRKTTRTVIQTDVELATTGELTPWKVKKAGQSGSLSAPSQAAPSTISLPPVESAVEEDWQAEEEISPPIASIPSKAPAPSYTTYTVEKGDSLEKIASKVYQDSRQWRRIYEANMDRVKNPHKLSPGQELVIPHDESQKKTTSAGDLK